MTSLSTEFWQKIQRTLPVVCVDLVVVHRGRMLMLDRADYPQGWWTPGGRVLHLERRAAAAERKLQLECGLYIPEALWTPHGTHEFFFADAPVGGTMHTVTTVHRFDYGEIDGSFRLSTIHLDATSRGYDWRFPEEWLKIVQHPFLRALLEEEAERRRP